MLKNLNCIHSTVSLGSLLPPIASFSFKKRNTYKAPWILATCPDFNSSCWKVKLKNSQMLVPTQSLNLPRCSLLQEVWTWGPFLLKQGPTCGVLQGEVLCFQDESLEGFSFLKPLHNPTWAKMLPSDMCLRVKGPLRALRFFSMHNVNPEVQLTALLLNLIGLKSIINKASLHSGFLIEFQCSLSTFNQPLPFHTNPVSFGNLSKICAESPCVQIL